MMEQLLVDEDLMMLECLSGLRHFNVTMTSLLPYNLLNVSDFDVSSAQLNDISESAAQPLSSAHDVIRTYLVPTICGFGLIGNALNLVVLACDRVRLACDSQERTVHVWLKALSVSDFLLCASLLPHGLLTGNSIAYRSLSFQLIYRTYSDAFINYFILVSTWLTVTMASSRYIAICHPFKARQLRSKKGTKFSVAIVFCICLAFSLPRFFIHRIDKVSCSGDESDEGPTLYALSFVYLNSDTSRMAHTAYMWIYFTLGVFLPLMALAFCNIRLVMALRHSMSIRLRFGVSASHVAANQRITTTLVTIAAMYIFLVVPGEVVSFLVQQVSTGSIPAQSHWTLLVVGEVTNVMQNINFSSNFILYSILNVHFRRVLGNALCRSCRGCKSNSTSAGGPCVQGNVERRRPPSQLRGVEPKVQGTRVPSPSPRANSAHSSSSSRNTRRLAENRHCTPVSDNLAMEMCARKVSSTYTPV